MTYRSGIQPVLQNAPLLNTLSLKLLLTYNKLALFYKMDTSITVNNTLYPQLITYSTVNNPKYFIQVIYPLCPLASRIWHPYYFLLECSEESVIPFCFSAFSSGCGGSLAMYSCGR